VILRNRPSANGQPPGVEDWPQSGPSFDPELLESTFDLPTAYDARPSRPVLQQAARAGLWGAVAIGCLGGIVGLVGQASPPPAPTAAPVADDSGVPAAVAGVAERAVGAWLSATETTNAEELAILFIEPPLTRVEERATLVTEDVATVAGQLQMEGYWSVTVAADVVETRPAPDADAAATDPLGGSSEGVDPGPVADEGTDAGAVGDDGPVRATWYIQVGIVGDVSGGLRALTTPSILPGPPGTLPESWRSSANPLGTASPEDPVTSTIQGFLQALLADGGDPQRYLASGLSIEAASPPMFESVEVTGIAVDTLEDGQTRALAQIEGRTPGGLAITTSYEVILTERTDRLEITGFSGSPTLVVPAAEEPVDETPPPDDTGAGGAEVGE
jgi:hypothetical protein